MPMESATARAPSSSPVASAGETAVTASARGPSARAASAATSEESTPPENATIAPSNRSSRALEPVAELSSVVAIVSSRVGGGERARPDGLNGSADPGRERRAVVVLRREVDDLAAKPAALDAHRAAGDVDGDPVALELVAVVARDAHAQRAGVAQERFRRPPRGRAGVRART